MRIYDARGQTTVEYLVILATVLVIGLIAVGLSLFYSQTSGDITQAESVAYWSSQVRPLRVYDMQGYAYSNGAPGEIALVLENLDSKPITVKNFVLEPYPASGSGMNASFNHSADGSQMSAISPGNGAGPGVLYANQFSVKLAPSAKQAFYLRTGYLCTNSGQTTGTNNQSFKATLTIYYDTPNFPQLSFKGIKPILGRCNPA